MTTLIHNSGNYRVGRHSSVHDKDFFDGTNSASTKNSAGKSGSDVFKHLSGRHGNPLGVKLSGGGGGSYTVYGNGSHISDHNGNILSKSEFLGRAKNQHGLSDKEVLHISSMMHDNHQSNIIDRENRRKKEKEATNRGSGVGGRVVDAALKPFPMASNILSGARQLGKTLRNESVEQKARRIRKHLYEISLRNSK